MGDEGNYIGRGRNERSSARGRWWFEKKCQTRAAKKRVGGEGYSETIQTLLRKSFALKNVSLRKKHGKKYGWQGAKGSG